MTFWYNKHVKDVLINKVKDKIMALIETLQALNNTTLLDNDIIDFKSMETIKNVLNMLEPLKDKEVMEDVAVNTLIEVQELIIMQLMNNAYNHNNDFGQHTCGRILKELEQYKKDMGIIDK